MFIPMISLLNGNHYESKICKPGIQLKAQCESMDTLIQELNHKFSLNGQYMEQVNNFRYLGRPLTKDDSYWKDLHHNLTKYKFGTGFIKF